MIQVTSCSALLCSALLCTALLYLVVGLFFFSFSFSFSFFSFSLPISNFSTSSSSIRTTHLPLCFVSFLFESFILVSAPCGLYSQVPMPRTTYIPRTHVQSICTFLLFPDTPLCSTAAYRYIYRQTLQSLLTSYFKFYIILCFFYVTYFSFSFQHFTPQDPYSRVE